MLLLAMRHDSLVMKHDHDGIELKVYSLLLLSAKWSQVFEEG